MSMRDYEQAKAIIEANAGQSDFGLPPSEDVIGKAEIALGIKYPSIYRRFLVEYGAGAFGSLEVYGVINEDWEESSVPDGVWCTLTSRGKFNLPKELVEIGDDGMGGSYVIDTSKPDGPVFVMGPDPDMATVLREHVASDFGAYLLDQVQQRVS